MAVVEVWFGTDTAWKRRYRSDIIIAGNDGFVVGTTRPTLDLCGVLAGISRTTYTGPTSITGWSTQADALANAIVSKNITNLISIASGYVYFLNCKFTGAGGTSDTAQVDCRATNVARVTFERCSFDPVTPNYWLNNLIGHHMTALRCHFRRGVDSIGSYNTHGSHTDNIVQGNYFENTCRFDVDQTHTDGTHNDTIQHQGGIGLLVEGNLFIGHNLYGDGSVPAAPYNRTSQCVLTQENVAIAGAYYCSDITIRNNWVGDGYQQVFVIKTRATSGSPYDATVENNTWITSGQRDWGGSLHFYNVRLGSETTINGISYPFTGGTADTHGNVYSSDAEVAAAYRGLPILVRRDSTPV